MSTSKRREAGGRIYSRVHNALWLRLTDGTYRVGDMFPGQRDLVKDLQVSRDAVQKVLKDLADKGFVVSVRGSGTRVIALPTTKDWGRTTCSSAPLSTSTWARPSGSRRRRWIWWRSPPPAPR
ncbi:winged helix-turn-helix domain-containing protein [Streptomyces sp. WM6386]|uniref:winged helix-turn-helix domain-containing protein n=1 Tax=Streptomyces sp. WM6386 TaxID=1415558 RepID=UPI000BA29511